MRRSVLVLCLASCSGKDRKDGDKQGSNTEKIIGKWSLTKAPKGAALGTIFEFSKDGKVNWMAGEGDEPIPGTYKIEGDKLTICWGEPDEKRPKKFITKTAVGAGEWLATYQRVKDDSAAAEKPEKGGKPAGSSTRPAEDTKKDDAANAELKKLEGNWRLTREEQRGNLRALIEQKKPGVFFEDGKIQWTSAYMGHGGARGDVAANPAAEPKEIDVEITRGSGLGKKVLGIYKIEGDKLTICWGELDGKRPKKFVTTTAIGAGEYLQTFQRVKDDADTAGSKPKPAEGATKREPRNRCREPVHCATEDSYPFAEGRG